MCDLLANQTVPVELYVWNNNHRRRRDVEAVASDAALRVHVVHSRLNIGGFGRFYLARQLAGYSESVVFIDDDQEFAPRAVEGLLSLHRPRSIAGWWAWRFGQSHEYFDRERIVIPGDPAAYVGTGGMIADTAVFVDRAVFECPSRFWFVEDLWLCYVASHLRRWQLFASDPADFAIVEDENDLYLTLGRTKTRLLRDLVRRGWTLPGR